MTKPINRVAVIGAGTMGAAIAAHVANAGIPVYLLDIAPRELTPDEEAKGLTLEHTAVRNRIVQEGWQRCLKARPAQLFAWEVADRVTLGNLEDNLEWLAEADWIVEAIIERLDIKQGLMARIEGVRKAGSIVSTNTSGIPIGAIAEGRSDDFQAHFMGTHFFNPPRYLKLLEIIPHAGTDPEIVRTMKQFGTRSLGKGVVVCKDTPNFIANRFLGIAGTHTMNYALEHGYTVEEVDALTGPAVGYPKTATFRLYDLVGVDVMALVMENLYQAIPHDPYREALVHEEGHGLIESMVERGWLGNKSRQGFYKRVETEEGRQFWVLDPETMEHRPATKPRFESLEAHRSIEAAGERIKRLCAEEGRAGQFIWATRAFGLNYAASIVPEVTDDILSIDNACKWGFGHELGPFETWDALGVAESVARMEAEGMEVTPWVKEMLAGGHATFYQREGGRLYCYSPISKDYVPVEPDPRGGDLEVLKREERRVIAGNESASLVDLGDGVLCLEFHSKANSLNAGIFEMLSRAGEELAGEWVGMVIGNQGKHFCAGADLTMFLEYAEKRAWDTMGDLIQQMQATLLSFRHSPKPVVSAPFGMVLGGGAEMMMGASAICAAAESYIGQVEAGVGVVPALGGCTEPVRRVLAPVIKDNPNADLIPYLQKVFEMIAMGKVSGSATEAREWGFLTPGDRIVMNGDHLLFEAKRLVLEMAASDYRPPVRGKTVWAMGAVGLAALKMVVWSFKEAGYLLDHDVLIANKMAYILTGGELSRPQWVEPEYMLGLEREAFLSLLGEPKTIERIQHMLKTKRVLRN
jgi:3-hydroxyacyl-CoA dehydrogenase